MTDTQLLKKIAEIVDKKLATQLEPIKQIQQEQSADLSEIKTTLNTHTTTLKQHTVTLKTHSTILEAHGKDMKDVKKTLSAIKTRLNRHTKSLRDINSKIGKIDWTVTYISKTFDARIVQNIHDIKVIKSHLGLSS